MKNLLKIAALGLVGVILAGCAGGISKEAKQAVGWSNAPQWVIDGNDGGYSAVGDAPIIDKNVQFARSEATTAAKAELMRRIQSTISSNLSKEGVRVDSQINEKVNYLVLEATKGNLQGVGVEKTWIDNQGTRIFILVKLSKEAQKQIQVELSKQFEVLQPEKLLEMSQPAQ